MRRFTTERLAFRRVTPDDAELIHQEVDEELTRYWIDWEPPVNVAETRRSIVSAAAKGVIEFAAFTAGGEFVGCCGLGMTDYGEREIDVWVKRSARGKGFATEMVRGIIRVATRLGLPSIIYSVTEGNAPSEAIARKLGAPLHREWTATKRGCLRTVRDYRIDL